MHDVWEARLPLGSRTRRGEHELYIDDGEQSPWQPLARYAVTSGPIGIEVVDVMFDVRGFAATPEDIGLRVATAEHLVPRGQIGADRGDTLELYVSPRIAAALSRDWRVDADDKRRLVVHFDFWAETHSQREELIVELQPRLRRLDELSLEIVPALSQLRLPAPVGTGPADSIEVCTLRAVLPPRKRLLKGRIAHSAVRIDVVAASEAVRLLVGDSLILIPDADDTGVADQSAIRSAEGGWSFPQRSLIDVAFPARQRVGLDAGVLNRRLPSISDLGASGQIPVRITVEHTLAVDGEDGTMAAHSGNATIDVVLDYDLSPRFFLELPPPGSPIALFAKRDPAAGTATPRITIPLPPLTDGIATEQSRSEAAITLQLRLVGVGGHAVQPWYHIDGVHTDYQPLPQVVFPDAGLDRPAPPAALRIPIAPIVERFEASGQRTARVNVYLQRLGATPTDLDNHQVTLDLLLERPRSGALLCIDWGASSIAAGFTDDRNPEHVLTLPLGEIYRKAAGLGGRAAVAAQGAVLLDDDMPDLISSRLSLSGRLNFRAAMSPFSYLDLRAGGTTDLAIARRVLALGRHYDIALPIPSASFQSGDPEAATILPPLKMLIAESRDKLVLPEPVIARAAAQRIVRTPEISIPDVMLDCLDEIRGFYLTETVRHYASRDPRRGAELERALAHGDLRLVLTHPCGLSRHLIARYRDAGRRMLARLDRGLLPPMPGLSEPSLSPGQPDGAVALVPESLAAAYFALRREIDRPGSRITDHPARLVALDVGAGTFDVSVLDVAFRPGDVESWDVRCHYGVRIGGHDLDLALTRLADALLEAMLERRTDLEYTQSLTLDATDTAANPDQRLAASRFSTALELAKRTLTEELFAASASTGEWAWTDGRKLRILVGRAGESSWPVVAQGRVQIGNAASLADGRVSLSVVREVADGAARDQIVLEIDNIFSINALESFAGTPRVRAALSEVIGIGELISRRLPEASLTWLDERGKGPRDGAATCLSVTGRAALWPPIFAGFQRLAGRLGAVMLGSGEATSRPPPMAPDLMKKAVMLGAYHLARFPHFLDRPVPPAPLAIRFIPLVAQTGAHPGARRIAYLDDIVRDGPSGPLKGLDNSSLLQLARVVPGIEHLADLSGRDGPPLWADLLPSALNPVGLSVMRTLPEKIDIEVERGDDGEIRAVTFKADQQTRRRIDDDGSTFIA